MGIQRMVEFFKKMRKNGYVQVTLVGGEPYADRKALEALLLPVPIIPWIWLVTSGTTTLKQFPNTIHFISIDGANAQTHDRIRGMTGLYDRIHYNLRKARAKWANQFPVKIHSVLNAKNYQQIEALLAHWSTYGLADGVLFSTMTPIRDAEDEDLRLTEKQRNEIVLELIRQKSRFGDFLCMSSAMIRSLHPDHTRNLTPETCEVSNLIKSYNTAGETIKQCILSEKADCSKCGCVIHTMLNNTVGRTVPDWETFQLMINLTPA
jgi:Fe-coproporphyrin III synthase